MQTKTRFLIAAVVAAFVAQGALAADKKPAGKAGECAEQSEAPKASSEKSRADVKAGAKAGSGECEASAAPAAKSEKKRAEVKKEVKAAVKSGEMSKSDALEQPKK